MRPPGPAANRVGSSEDLEIPQRTSGPPTWPRRGGYAPFTQNYPYTPAFDEHGPYAGRGCAIWDPAGSVVDRIGSSGNFDIPQRTSGPSKGHHGGGIAPFTKISPDPPEFKLNAPILGAGERNMRLS